MTAMSISALLCVSTASALLQQSINTQCDLGSTAPGSDVSCAASVEYIDNVPGSTDAIETTVTFSFLGGECWNPRISYQFRETDFVDGDEFISLFQRGPTSVAGHMIVEGDGADENYGVIKNAECALDTATRGSVTNDYGSKIGVQCCNDIDDASEAYREELGCVSAVTFEAAEKLCADKGYRLCTQGEVQNGLGDRIGCEFNAYHVWTSTECRGTAITQCGDSGAATDCESMTTCADLMVLPDGEDIGGADSVDIVVYVSEDVDGLHHAADNSATCANAYNVESFLTLTCKTPTEAPTPAPTDDPSPSPTRAPSTQPTPAPTAQPTASPTTAQPTTGAPTMDGCDFSYPDYVATCQAGQDWHWIANGDGDDEDESQHGINKADECMVDNSRNSIQQNNYGNVIGTQCCSYDGLTPFRGDDDCDAAKGLTFSEAEQYCADAGYRLCTRAEIAAIGPDRWEGCFFDAFLVWTSDQCIISARDAPRTWKINFQEQSYPTPSGYKADTGEPYGSRGSGDLYGWDCDISEDVGSNKGGRSVSFGDDPLANSQMVLDRHGLCANEKTMWKILVPNGVYSVTMGGVNTAGCTLQGLSLGTGTGTGTGIQTLELVTRTVTVVNQFIEFEGGWKHDCGAISTIVIEESVVSVVSSAKGIHSRIDVDGDAVVMIKVPKAAFEMFVFAVVAISVLMCVGWCFRGVCRKKAGYAKVVYLSESATEEKAAINACDEQL